MTDATPSAPTPAPTTVAPPTVAEILATVRNAINTLPEPTRTDTIDSLDYLDLAIINEVNAAVKSYATKVPLGLGSLVAGAVTSALDTLIEQGFVQVVPVVGGS